MKRTRLLTTLAFVMSGLGVAGCVPATATGPVVLVPAPFSPDLNERSNSGRDRPRIPGGSGCDDPDDLIEHPECRP